MTLILEFYEGCLQYLKEKETKTTKITMGPTRFMEMCQTYEENICSRSQITLWDGSQVLFPVER